MHSRDTVYFATSAGHAALTADDRLAADALAARGLQVRPLVWSEARPPRAAAVVIRSCWDYHLHPRRFGAWLDQLEADGVAVFNPVAQLRWNLHKRYLLELQAQGVAIPPTRLLEGGSRADLAKVAQELRHEDLVVKPAVSLSAHGTWRAHPARADDRARFAAQLGEADLLVQAYVPGIEQGELSLMYFGGRLSHAVRKRPAPGDFRVQADFGGTRELVAAPAGARRTSDALVARCAADALYCRVDGVETPGGFVLMELELIDPVLFFALHPPAAAGFADAFCERIATA